MPAIRDYSQNYSSAASGVVTVSTPSYAQNDLILAMGSNDTGATGIQWIAGEDATVVFQYTNSGAVYTNYTTNFNSTVASTWYMTGATAAASDACYFGRSAVFNGISVTHATAGAGTQTWVWEYWNGAAWTTLTTLVNGITLAATTGVHGLSFNVPVDWATTAVNGQTQYWVRMRISAYTSQTTRPIFNRGGLGTFNQLYGIFSGTTAHHAVMWKVASASEPTEYIINDQQTTADTRNVALITVRDIDPLIPLAHATVAALTNTTGGFDRNLDNTTTRASQSFVAPATAYRMASVRFSLKKVGAPTGNAVVKLYTHSGTLGTSSVPTGVGLAISNNFDVSTLTTGYQWIEFTFPWQFQYLFTASTNYCIAIEYTGTATDYIAIEHVTTSAHAGNEATYAAAAWTAQAAQDLKFEVNYFTFTTSTSTAARFVMPTMTTKRNKSIAIYSVSNSAASVPSIIEGPVSLICAKDGSAHADGMSWGWVQTAGTTSAAVYCSTLLTASIVQTASVCAINPPSTGATVIPPYPVSDASLYVAPFTGAAYSGVGTDSAPVNTVTSAFGSTLNGKTLSNGGTTYTAADTGVNTYHAMANVTGLATANVWAGNRTTIASRNLSNRNILFHIQPTTPVAIQTTDSVAGVGTIGFAIGLGSTANTNYKVWHLGGANTPWGASDLVPAVIHSGYTGAGMIQNTGTLNAAAVVEVGLFVSGKVAAANWAVGSVWALDNTVIAGGFAAEPIGVDEIIAVAARGYERKSVIQLGDAMIIYQPLQFGDAGTNAVYVDLDTVSIGFPRQYNKTLKQVNYCSIDNVVGITLNLGASDTFKLTNSLISSANKYHFVIHANCSTSATLNLAGSAIIGAGTVTLKSGITLSSVSFNSCDPIASVGAILTNCSFSSNTGNNAVTVASAAEINSITNCSFKTNSRAIKITAAGTYNLSGLTFSGNTYDIENASTGAVIINNTSGSNAVTYINTNGGTTTINNPVSVTISANSSLSGAEIRIYDLDNSPAGSLGTELAGTESHNSANYVYQGTGGNSIWIQIMLAGYREYGQQYTIPASDSTLTVKLVAETNS